MNKTLLLTAAVLLIAGCGGNTPKSQNRSAGTGITVRVRKALASDNITSSSYVGTVESSRQATVTAPVPGTLVSISVREGQKVTAGQVLARIESQSVSSAYDAARARLDQAEDAWERVSRVHDSGSISEADYIDMKTKLEEARAAESAAGKSLEKCSLKAPFGGIIQSIPLSRGVEVAPGETVLRIVDIRDPEIHFPLPEKEFSLHNIGEKASVEVPALGITLEGKLQNKGVSASPLSHSYDCTVSLSSAAGQLMPGMVCKVYLGTAGERAIVVPASAVMTDMEGRYVWTANGGLVEKKYIEPGGYAGDGIIVRSGLSDKDSVVVEGSRKVSVGMRVKTVE